MSIKIKKGILAVIIFLTEFIYSEDVYAVDYETALQLQQIANENYYAVLNQQQAAANLAQAALQAQQNAAQAALKAQQSAMEAALKAQQSATEAATAIQLASLTTPQVDVVCDTNCSEQNAMLYGKFYPDFVLVDLSEQRAIF